MIYAAILAFCWAALVADFLLPELLPCSYDAQRAIFWVVLLAAVGLLQLPATTMARRKYAIRDREARFGNLGVRVLGYGTLALLILTPVSCATRTTVSRQVEVVGEWEHRDISPLCHDDNCWTDTWCAVHPVLKDVTSGEVRRAEMPEKLAGRWDFFPYKGCDGRSFHPAGGAKWRPQYRRAKVVLKEGFFGTLRVESVQEAVPETEPPAAK